LEEKHLKLMLMLSVGVAAFADCPPDQKKGPFCIPPAQVAQIVRECSYPETLGRDDDGEHAKTPEPGSFALAGMALIGVGVSKRIARRING
jgi:hypothetical protein